jgi:hypothetical protein
MWLLVHYGDGSREALAQYRWDESEVRDIQHCTSIYFQRTRNDIGSHYLTDVYFDGPPDKFGRPLKGELVWWYNSSEDYICIDGKDVFDMDG